MQTWTWTKLDTNKPKGSGDKVLKSIIYKVTLEERIRNEKMLRIRKTNTLNDILLSNKIRWHRHGLKLIKIKYKKQFLTQN